MDANTDTTRKHGFFDRLLLTRAQPYSRIKWSYTEESTIAYTKALISLLF